ncbi:group XIIA secretory phospholipase A2-like [Saccostrea echinata]|uniref:group XIIA secretory phospholipase A2-like n=1 Tax=Saccostrea echinata TaxID=191078 RepID=UPI002A8252B1|nr:group XIIA secretory phospholipase A2-like [Saccostrea echinata]
MAVARCVVLLPLLSQVLVQIQGNSRDLLDEMLQDGEAGNMEGMFDKVGDMLGELVDSLDTINSPCKFKCPNGVIPKERKNHIRSSNGCGTFGIEIDTSSVPLMTSCCDDHDFCYDKCNNDKEKCDNDFKTCLLNMCKKMKNGLKSDEYEGCKATAELMFTGTNMLGCNSYKEAQAKACDCGNIDQDTLKEDKVQANTGKSTLTHERKIVNAEPIPGTENASARKSKKSSESETLLKATKLKQEGVHRHDDL